MDTLCKNVFEVLSTEIVHFTVASIRLIGSATRHHVSSICDIKPTIYGGNTSNIIQLFTNFELIVYLFQKLCTGSEDSFVYLLGNLSVISIYDVHYDILL